MSPTFVPVSTFEPRFTYTDLGTVFPDMPGRAALVRRTGVRETVIGCVLSWNDGPSGRWFATPDTDVPYHERRWVGGFRTRKEAAVYLRGHEDAGAEWFYTERVVLTQ